MRSLGGRYHSHASLAQDRSGILCLNLVHRRVFTHRHRHVLRRDHDLTHGGVHIHRDGVGRFNPGNGSCASAVGNLRRAACSQGLYDHVRQAYLAADRKLRDPDRVLAVLRADRGSVRSRHLFHRAVPRKGEGGIVSKLNLIHRQVGDLHVGIRLYHIHNRVLASV